MLLLSLQLKNFNDLPSSQHFNVDWEPIELLSSSSVWPSLLKKATPPYAGQRTKTGNIFSVLQKRQTLTSRNLLSKMGNSQWQILSAALARWRWILEAKFSKQTEKHYSLLCQKLMIQISGFKPQKWQIGPWEITLRSIKRY